MLTAIFKASVNDGTRTSFAMFSRSFRKLFEVFVGLETCWDPFGPARMHLDLSGYFRKRSDIFGTFGIFSTFFVLVPNTGEANDEMCGPTAPKIFEICSLKPFNCLLSLVLFCLAKTRKTVFEGK